MFAFDRIDGFDWDHGNSRKSSDKHTVSQSEAEQVFADSGLYVSADERHSSAEARFHALGATAAGRLLHVTFTLRDGGRKIRVISARVANRKERSIYENKS
ncbi:MAG: BrnT family toxin [Pseudolabrys sp.]